MFIITGASRGIGKVILNRLNFLGYETCGISRDVSNINGRAFKCDVSDFNQIKKVAKL